MCPHECARARPSSPGPARRARASRDADAARDPSTTPRAIPRRRRAIPRPRRSSPRRRAVGFARVVPRAWRVGVESKRRARLARDSRDARAIRDSRPTYGSSLARRARARRGTRRGRGRASPCAASRASRRGRGRADRPRPTDRVFSLCTHTKRSPRVASSHCLPTRDGPLREATTPDTPSTRARRRQSTTTTTTTMLAQRAQAFATGGATVASRARARATRGRTGRRAQTRAGIPIHIEYCEK